MLLSAARKVRVDVGGIVQRARGLWQVLTYLGVGLIEWLALVALPARHNPDLSGVAFFVVTFASAIVMGWVDYETGISLPDSSLLRPPSSSAGVAAPVETMTVSGS